MTNKFLYFAYGSNMLTRRLRNRTPSAVAIGTGFVEGHRLTFDKVSTDGSGKCNIAPTNDPADRVYGVLFSIEIREAPNLDEAEGLGRGYRKSSVQVVRPTGVQVAVAYFAATQTRSCCRMTGTRTLSFAARSSTSFRLSMCADSRRSARNVIQTKNDGAGTNLSWPTHNTRLRISRGSWALALTPMSLFAVSSMLQPFCAALMHQKKSAVLRSRPEPSFEGGAPATQRS